MKKRPETRRAGSAMVLGFDGTEMTPALERLLRDVQPAGVVLFKRNVQTAAQTWELLRACERAAGRPLLRCVDMEGGTVDRLRDIVGPAPAAAEVFASRDRKLFRKHGSVIGATCRALGFNVDFAPVLDLALAPARPVLTTRVVSADPKEAAEYAGEFLRGLRDAGVQGCGKHFPGLGEAALDTHHDLPSVAKSWKKLWAEDMAPYRLLRTQLPMVMVSHAAYPAVTRTPASLAPEWMSGALRRKVGFRGVIATDDMEMGALQKFAPMAEAAVAAVRAGADLLLVCHREDLIRSAHEALVCAAERDSRFRRRLAESARRVAGLQKKARRLSPQPTVARVEGLTRQLWELGEQVRLETLDRDSRLEARA
jgi:beta-N-acetylhexosaminidase